MKQSWKIIISIIIVVIIASIFIWFININNSENVCEDIWNVNSITVRSDSIQIEFNTSSGGFQVVGRKSTSGSVEPFEYGSTFIVNNGDNIYWGDGDHYFNYLTLEDVKDKSAYITIKDEFYWNGKTTTETKRCMINNNFP